MLRESVVVDRQLEPGTTFEWQGIDLHVIGTPGRSDGAVSHVFDLDGLTFAFTGDLICGPGQIRDFHGLQKRLSGMPLDYWGFGGAVPEVPSRARPMRSCGFRRGGRRSRDRLRFRSARGAWTDRPKASWQAQQGSAAISIPGETDGAMRLTAFAPLHPRQRTEVIGVWIRFDGRAMGEVAEAVVEYYGSCCLAH